jgi:hypothetical protein
MSGLLNLLDTSSVAYLNGCSNYPYEQYSTSTSSSTIQPGYDPPNNGLSHFTVYNGTNSTPYFASFILQQQQVSTTQEITDVQQSIANSIISVPVYIQESATANFTATDGPDATWAGTPYFLYHSSIADVTLNSPTNPNSSVYNIFMNMTLFDYQSGSPPSGATDASGFIAVYSIFKKFRYTTTTNSFSNSSSDPVCDVLLTLSAQGKTMESSVFSLSSQQITVGNPNPIKDTNTFNSKPGVAVLSINLPISSIFPQISTPGITFRIKTEIIGYV